MTPPAPSTAPAIAPAGLEPTPLALALDALLPQTQCRQCGYAGCLPYAQAMADGTAPVNRCPPGGIAGMEQLAQRLGTPPLPLDARCGTPRPLHVAWIDEARCIGCTLCIQACPVDAIAGATKAMHTVVADECTGCDLCLPPCPMDCILLVPVQPAREWTRADADAARRRLHLRERRAARERADNDERLGAKALGKLAELEARAAAAPQELPATELARRKALVEAALARVRQRRAAARPEGGA